MNCKKHLRLFGIIYGLALAFAAIGRLAIMYLDSKNLVTYHYIAKSNVPMLTKLLSIFTGVQLVALLVSFGIVFCVFMAAYFVFAVDSNHKQKVNLLEVSVYGLTNIIASVAVFAIFFVSSLSKLQLRAMKSSGGMGIALLLMLVCFISLFVARVKIHDLILKDSKLSVMRFVLGPIAFTIVSALLTAMAFAKFNLLVPDIKGLTFVLALAASYNILVILILTVFSKKENA